MIQSGGHTSRLPGRHDPLVACSLETGSGAACEHLGASGNRRLRKSTDIGKRLQSAGASVEQGPL